MTSLKRKIVFFHKSLIIGGAEAILVNYLKILAKNNDLDVELWILEEQLKNAYIERIPPQIKLFFLLDKKETNELSLKQQSLLACERIINLLSKNKLSLIVNFNSHFDFFLAQYSLNIPVIRWIHGIAHCNYWEKHSDFFHFILSKHRCLIVVNEELKKHCLKSLKRLRVKNIPIYSIYNPIDIESILNQANQKENKYPKYEYLLQVSRLDAAKNHLQLINIYAKLKKLGVKEKLLIIGTGDTYHQLQQQINQLGLTQDCLLLGSKSNPYPFMKNAKLFLHTSLSEGLPTVLIESIVLGVPVVAMDCQTGPKEILNNGEYGELVKLKDEEEFVQKTYNLLTNKDILQNFKEKTKIATDRFSFDNIEKSINELFIQIFSNNSPENPKVSYSPYQRSFIKKVILQITKYLIR